MKLSLYKIDNSVYYVLIPKYVFVAISMNGIITTDTVTLVRPCASKTIKIVVLSSPIHAQSENTPTGCVKAPYIRFSEVCIIWIFVLSPILCLIGVLDYMFILSLSAYSTR